MDLGLLKNYLAFYAHCIMQYIRYNGNTYFRESSAFDAQDLSLGQGYLMP